jgi:hypothetical protein
MGRAVSATATLVIALVVCAPAFWQTAHGSMDANLAAMRFLIAVVIAGLAVAVLRAVVDAYAGTSVQPPRDIIEAGADEFTT